MTMHIYVPSLGRYDNRLFSGPAAQMPEGVLVHYVVPEQEARRYAASLIGYRLPARILPCPVKGIAATRLWIGEHAKKNGASKFVMIDDDIGFLIRRGIDTWRLRSPEIEETAELLNWVENALDEHEHVGISAREGNNTVGVGDIVTLVAHNSRTLRFLAYQTDAFLRVEHCRVAVMEDFDVNLQILRAGGSILVSYWFSQGQRMTNEDGGCSTYRSHEVHEASAIRLNELHPNFVTLRQKSNKTDQEGFGTRTEVTIAWKNAFKEGQKNVKTTG